MNPARDADTGEVPSPAELDHCRRCELWRCATHAVPGEGKPRARLMLIGEQPGDQEDQAGRPFVGPAGRLLDELLQEAGLARGAIYVTNAVKHFKWEPRGKQRLHRRPSAGEIDACHPWLGQEIAAVRPRWIVALGATAARSVLRRAASIESSRGKLFEHPLGAAVYVTYHPSAILRANERAAQMRAALVEDLRRIAQQMSKAAGPRRQA